MTTFHSADDVLTLLVHLGYLGYDAQKKEAYIPNREIQYKFINVIEDQWSSTFEVIFMSGELLQVTLKADEKSAF